MLYVFYYRWDGEYVYLSETFPFVASYVLNGKKLMTYFMYSRKKYYVHGDLYYVIFIHAKEKVIVNKFPGIRYDTVRYDILS